MASLSFNYLDSDLDSDPKVIPKSLPALLSTLLSPEIGTELINLLSTEIPLPPLDQLYTILEARITAINDYSRVCSYIVISRRLKRTKKGIKKTIRLSYNRQRTISLETQDDLSIPNTNLSVLRNPITLANKYPFAILLRLQYNTGTQNIIVENLTYNYSLSVSE